ncbi:protein FAM114A2 [Echinococcus multilocularis]|uniref:Protein FAM114A2 n=1 Tax=Echinococcus multilocularis TaxID=6211 RepID=A0A068Y0Z8_ECHMU|nr:protein FAM114A2 [Echinococcus multilocularis]
MADESGDEIFASADEGSDNESTLMKSNYVKPSGGDEDLVTSLIDVGPTKNTKLPKDNKQVNVEDKWDFWCKDSTPIVDTLPLQKPMGVSPQKDIGIDTCKFSLSSDPWDVNQDKTLQHHTEVSASVDVNQPLIDLDEKLESRVADLSEFIQTERMHSKDDDLDATKIVPSVENTEALTLRDDPQSKRLGMIEDPGLSNEVDSWDLDDPWASSQIPNTEASSTEIDEAVSTNDESQNSVSATESKKFANSDPAKETDGWDRSWDGSRATLSALEPKTRPMMTTESQDQDELICTEAVQIKDTDSKLNEAQEAWDSIDDPWTSLKSKNAEDPLVVNSETVPAQTTQQEKLISTREVQKNISIPLSDEKVDAWDLEDDPWSSSGTVKPSTYLASDTVKISDSVPIPKSKKDDLNMEVEEDWDSMEDLQIKSPAVITSQELASAATALVKSVGGGLASFVGSFKLSNLSSTLAAFEEKTLAKPVECEQQQKPPQSEALGSRSNDGDGGTAADGGEASGGWGTWDLGSLAKSLTSTVENTGLQIIHGGVDVLEQIGRKTFTALKENDPGLVYTKSFLRPVGNSQVSKLSQVLREASDQHTAQLSDEPLSSQSEARRGDLASQLESRLALVHMEALELLSSRASARLGMKLAQLEGPHNNDDEEHHHSVCSLTAEGGVLERIWQTLQLKDQEEKEDATEEEASVSATALVGTVTALEAVAPGNALLKTCEEVQQKCKHLESDVPMKEIFYQAVEALADLTSAILAYLHKLAECLLLLGHNRELFNTSSLDVAEKVASILTAAKRQNETICSVYVGHLKAAASSNSTEEGEEEALTTSRRLVANLFLETGMANSYLDDSAANYLVPVLQVACLDVFFPESTLTPASCHPPMSMKAKQR